MKFPYAPLGPYFLPFKGERPDTQNPFQYAVMEFCTDMTRASSQVLRYGILVSLMMEDGLILTGVGRSLIPMNELARVNMLTWGDAFERWSSISFLEGILADIQEKHGESPETWPGWITVYNRFPIHSALCTSTPRSIPPATAEMAHLSPEMTMEKVTSDHLRELLEELVDDVYPD